MKAIDALEGALSLLRDQLDNRERWYRCQQSLLKQARLLHANRYRRSDHRFGFLIRPPWGLSKMRHQQKRTLREAAARQERASLSIARQRGRQLKRRREAFAAYLECKQALNTYTPIATRVRKGLMAIRALAEVGFAPR